MRTKRKTIRAPSDKIPADAFSQIHLATAAERGVYRRFASDPSACWSDTEIALAVRLDMSEVTWGLERFADAGIVELVEGGCYRWRPKFRYIFERSQPPGSQTRDPVCGMPVTLDTPLRAEDVFGQTERFCSERCLAAFMVWPLAFTRRPLVEVLRRKEGENHGSSARQPVGTSPPRTRIGSRSARR